MLEDMTPEGGNFLIDMLEDMTPEGGNFLIDMLEDMTPEAICIHVSTNDINDDKSVDTISKDMENLIELTQH